MKIEISHSSPCFNFVVKAENKNEVELLRQFVKYNYNKDHRFWIHSHGGNIEQNNYSFCFGWIEEKHLKPKGFWKKLKYHLS